MIKIIKEIYKLKRPFPENRLFRVLDLENQFDHLFCVDFINAHYGITTILTLIYYKGHYICGMVLWDGDKICVAASKHSRSKRFVIEPAYYNYLKERNILPYPADKIESMLRRVALCKVEATEISWAELEMKGVVNSEKLKEAESKEGRAKRKTENGKPKTEEKILSTNEHKSTLIKKEKKDGDVVIAGTKKRVRKKCPAK